MDKPQPTFSLEEFLASLRPEEGREGWTVRELVEMAGFPQKQRYRSRIYREVTRLIEDEVWEYGDPKDVYYPSGRMQPCVTYRPKQEGG